MVNKLWFGPVLGSSSKLNPRITELRLGGGDGEEGGCQKNGCDCCLHSKKCWVVLTQFWVKYGQTQPLG